MVFLHKQLLMWHNALMSLTQTKKKEVKLLSKELEDGRENGKNANACVGWPDNPYFPEHVHILRPKNVPGRTLSPPTPSLTERSSFSEP